MRPSSRWPVWALSLALGLHAGLLPARALGQSLRIEIHPLSSVTLSDEHFLRGDHKGSPVSLASELRLPGNGGPRLPAVVLLHGSSGPSTREDEWARLLNRLGIATLLVDSFTGRGIVNTVNDQTQLGRLAMIVDAYRALALLAAHPRIDPSRIAVMGFSRGGQAALYSSLRRFQRLYAVHPQDRFAAHLAFYSPCNTTYREDTEVLAAPIRLFHGTLDSLVDVAPCREYVQRLRASAQDAQLIEYPMAAHMFDSPALSPPVPLPLAQSIFSCRLAEGPRGRILDQLTGQAFKYTDPCVHRGTVVAYDSLATASARETVAVFLSDVFHIP
jgi:dienelactone hydrolase